MNMNSTVLPMIVVHLFTPKFYKYSTRYTVDELNANVDNMYS